jgi:hypothetical protein
VPSVDRDAQRSRTVEKRLGMSFVDREQLSQKFALGQHREVLGSAGLGDYSSGCLPDQLKHELAGLVFARLASELAEQFYLDPPSGYNRHGKATCPFGTSGFETLTRDLCGSL